MSDDDNCSIKRIIRHHIFYQAEDAQCNLDELQYSYYYFEDIAP